MLTSERKGIMIEYLAILTPVLIGLVLFFVRQEGRIARIMTDICWIKKELAKCQPNWEKGSP